MAKVKKYEDQDEDNVKVTDELLKSLLPKGFKLPATNGGRADLLYEIDALRLAEKKKVDAIDKFQTKLEQWFIDNLPASEETGVAGKKGRVQIKKKDNPVVEDWSAFYTYVAKKKAFDLLQRKLNAKAVNERWENKEKLPGVGKFTKKVVSLTSVKGA